MTKTFRFILNLVCLVLLATISAEGKGWRGIVPLHSTRQDVERLLGPSKDVCKCIYKTQTEVITIEYARQTCRQNPNGWNVPPDTVLTINVSATNPPKFSDLNIDKRKYKRTRDLHTPAVYYSDEEEGIMYEVSEDERVGMTVYGPSISDATLRCPGAEKPTTNQFDPVFDQYGDVAFDYEKPRLDNFAAQLNYFSDSVGYIIVYPGPHTSSVKALSRARRARSYLVGVRRVNANRIGIIEGGRRYTFTTELYILPRTAPTPRPEPSIRRTSRT
jgi:hypothetical protein